MKSLPRVWLRLDGSVAKASDHFDNAGLDNSADK